LRFHDVLDRVLVLDEGDDAHLCFTFGTLQGVYLETSSTSDESGDILALSSGKTYHGYITAT
jgi:hypothetical protein